MQRWSCDGWEQRKRVYQKVKYIFVWKQNVTNFVEPLCLTELFYIHFLMLFSVSERVDVQKQFNIHITKTNLLERGLLQWQRQKKSSPTAILKVYFFGEAGVDTGALWKEDVPSKVRVSMKLLNVWIHICHMLVE